MSQVFGEMLPFAVVIALSPIPIVAVIAMVFSDRAVGNGVAFLVGWILGVAASLALITALASTQDLGSTDAPSNEVSLVRLGLGALCLVGAALKWRGRPEPGAEVPMPRWMARVQTMDPIRALGLAVVLGGVNPKNLLMNVAAATVLASAGLPRSEAVAAIAAYTTVASSTVALVVLYRLAAGDRAAATLARMREWLVANNAAVMTVLLLVFGAKLVGDAIAGI